MRNITYSEVLVNGRAISGGLWFISVVIAIILEFTIQKITVAWITYIKERR